MSERVNRLFDGMASSYDELEPWYEHLYDRVHALVAAALPAPSATTPGIALDAGCGTGAQTAILARLGYHPHGLDLSAGLLALARARLPDARLARGCLEQLPYRDAVFDAITCCGSTLSFVDDPAAALRELGRVLRPGGRLLLECEHKWSLDLAWAAASALVGDPLGYGLPLPMLWQQLRHGDGCVLPYPGYGPLRLFTRGELDRLLGAAGLVAVDAWGIHSATGLLPSTVLHRAQLPRALRGVYARLCAADRALAHVPAARAVASSLVLLARKG